MRTKQIPLIIMLTAGLVSSVITKLMHYELESALWILLAVLIVFYIIGCVLKRTIERFEKERQEAEEEAAAAAAAAVSDEGEVIEKDAQEEGVVTQEASG